MKKKLLLVAFLICTLTLVVGCEKKEEKEKEEKKSYDYLVLVNKQTKLPDDWEANVELVDAKNAWDEDIQVEKKVYKQYKKLKKNIRKRGNNN